MVLGSGSRRRRQWRGQPAWEKPHIGEPTSLARQGDGSLHAEVGLPASAIPPAVPAAEGQLLGLGS